MATRTVELTRTIEDTANPKRRPLRVCMLAYSFYKNDSRIRQYSRALVERGDEVDFIGLRRESDEAVEDEFGGVKLHRIQCRTKDERGPLDYLFRILRFFVHAFFVLTRLHLKKRYDVIHVHSIPDFLVFIALVPKLTGARVVLDIHDILPEFYASKFGSDSNSMLFRSLLGVERVSVWFADHVIVANRIWKDRIEERCHAAGKCTTICNYPDPNTFAPRATRKNNDGKFVLMYPGSLNLHQGLDIAVRAFARVADAMPEAEFHIYGEGPTKPALVDLASELGVNDRVLFRDFLPVHEIVERMSNADMAVVPKRATNKFGNEAASTKILEFMALGVPVVVTRTRIDSINFDESLVRFFPSDDDAELAKAILELRNSPATRMKMAANGLRHAKLNNWQVRKSEYLGMLDSLFGEKTKASDLPTPVR